MENFTGLIWAGFAGGVVMIYMVTNQLQGSMGHPTSYRHLDIPKAAATFNPCLYRDNYPFCIRGRSIHHFISQYLLVLASEENFTRCMSCYDSANSNNCEPNLLDKLPLPMLNPFIVSPQTSSTPPMSSSTHLEESTEFSGIRTTTGLRKVSPSNTRTATSSPSGSAANQETTSTLTDGERRPTTGTDSTNGPKTGSTTRSTPVAQGPTGTIASTLSSSTSNSSRFSSVFGSTYGETTTSPHPETSMKTVQSLRSGQSTSQTALSATRKATLDTRKTTTSKSETDDSITNAHGSVITDEFTKPNTEKTTGAVTGNVDPNVHRISTSEQPNPKTRATSEATKLSTEYESKKPMTITKNSEATTGTELRSSTLQIDPQSTEKASKETRSEGPLATRSATETTSDVSSSSHGSYLSASTSAAPYTTREQIHTGEIEKTVLYSATTHGALEGATPSTIHFMESTATNLKETTSTSETDSIATTDDLTEGLSAGTTEHFSSQQPSVSTRALSTSTNILTETDETSISQRNEQTTTQTATVDQRDQSTEKSQTNKVQGQTMPISATTAGHTVISAGHTLTTAGHTETTAGHTETTAGHIVTTAGHTVTTAGHTETTAGHTETTTQATLSESLSKMTTPDLTTQLEAEQPSSVSLGSSTDKTTQEDDQKKGHRTLTSSAIPPSTEQQTADKSTAASTRPLTFKQSYPKTADSTIVKMFSKSVESAIGTMPKSTPAPKVSTTPVESQLPKKTTVINYVATTKTPVLLLETTQDRSLTTRVPDSVTFVNTFATGAPTTESRPSYCDQPCPDQFWDSGDMCYLLVPRPQSVSYIRAISYCQTINDKTDMAWGRELANATLNEQFTDTLNAAGISSLLIYYNEKGSKEFRANKKVNVTSLSKIYTKFYGYLEFDYVINNQIINQPVDYVRNDVAAFCRTPRYCQKNRCAFSDFVDAQMDKIVGLPMGVEFLQEEDQVVLPCIRNDKAQTVRTRCSSFGTWVPHPSQLICDPPVHPTEEEEVEFEGNPRLQNSCAACYKWGTDKCERQENGLFKCVCKPGWTRFKCWKSPNMCANVTTECGPGKCRNLVDMYDCLCPVTFFGDKCQYNKTSMTLFGKTNTVAYMSWGTMGQITMTTTNLLLLIGKMCGKFTIYDDPEDCQETYCFLRKTALSAAGFVAVLWKNPQMLGVDSVSCRFFWMIINHLYTYAIYMAANEAINFYAVVDGLSRNWWGNYEGKYTWYFSYRYRVYYAMFALVAYYGLISGIYWTNLVHPWTCLSSFVSPKDELWLLSTCTMLTIGFFGLAFGEAGCLVMKNRPHGLIKVKAYFEHLWPCYKGILNKLRMQYVIFVMCYMPKWMSSEFEEESWRNRDEILAKHRPSRFAKEQQEKKYAIKVAKEKERDEIRKKNQELLKKNPDLPQRLLYHVPEDGPEQCEAVSLEMDMTQDCYIPDYKKTVYLRRWTRMYLEYRMRAYTVKDSIARVLMEEMRRGFLKKHGPEHDMEIRLYNHWCHTVPDRDHIKVRNPHQDRVFIMPEGPPDRLFIMKFDRLINRVVNAARQGLFMPVRPRQLPENPDVREFKQVLDFMKWQFPNKLDTLDFETADGNMHPQKQTFLKGADIVIEEQFEDWDAKLKEAMDIENAKFDKIYEDDVCFSQYIGTPFEEHARKIFNVQPKFCPDGERLANPRTRPIDNHFQDDLMPGFIGPAPSSRVNLGPYDEFVKKAAYYQGIVDGEWDAVRGNAAIQRRDRHMRTGRGEFEGNFDNNWRGKANMYLWRLIAKDD